MSQTTKPARPAGAGAIAPARPQRMTTTIRLVRPITENGQTWEELTVREPDLGDRIAAERKGEGMEAAIQLFAILTGLPPAAARKMKTRDARAIQTWLGSITPEPEPETEPDLSETKTFRLSVPIEADGRVLTEITLREPDLEAGIAVEKLKGRYEQTAASIAVLSGLTIPVVRRLVMRDVVRMEAWLLPFVADTSSTAAVGET